MTSAFEKNLIRTAKANRQKLAKRCGLERFGNHKIRPAILRQFQRVEIIKPRPAGHGDDAQIRMCTAQLQDGFNPFLIGHKNVHQNGVIPAFARINTIDGIAAIDGLLDRISGTAQHIAQGQPHLRIVIGDQNGFLLIRHFSILARKTYCRVNK